MTLEIRSERHGEYVALRCALRNRSGIEIDVDPDTLPCNNPGDFSANAVTADGKVSEQTPVLGANLSAHITTPFPHTPVHFGPGESWEGRMDMGSLRINDLPLEEDFLLVWSYPSLKDLRSQVYDPLSGITLVKATSLARASPRIELEHVGGTTVPAQSLEQDLRDAPETLVIHGVVLRLQAFPWRSRIRLHSESAAPVPPTLRVQALWMLGKGLIWNVDAIEETTGPPTESGRDFLVHDGPNWDATTSADVVVKLRDDDGATYFLALRHAHAG